MLLVMKSLVFSTSRNVCLAFSGGILLAYCGANFCTSSPTGWSSSWCAAAALGDGVGLPAESGVFLGNAYCPAMLRTHTWTVLTPRIPRHRSVAATPVAPLRLSGLLGLQRLRRRQLCQLVAQPLDLLALTGIDFA